MGTHLLRRVIWPDHIKNGTVKRQAFKPSERDRSTGLSVFLWPDRPSVSECEEWLDVFRTDPGHERAYGGCVVTLTEKVEAAISLHRDEIATPPGGHGERHHNARSLNPEAGSVAPTREDIDVLIAALDYGLICPVR